MQFFLKKKFFIEAGIGFLLFYGVAIGKMVLFPDDRAEILKESILSSLVAFIACLIPWYLAAHSSLAEGRKQLRDMKGGIDYLLRERSGLPDDANKRAEIDQKIKHAVALYNQQVEILDQVLGEYPSRLFVEFIFGYRRPRDITPEL